MEKRLSRVGRLLETFLQDEIENKIIELSDNEIALMFNLSLDSEYVDKVRQVFIDYVANTDIIFKDVRDALKELAFEYNLEIENNKIKDSKKMIKNIFGD